MCSDIRPAAETQTPLYKTFIPSVKETTVSGVQDQISEAAGQTASFLHKTPTSEGGWETGLDPRRRSPPTRQHPTAL